MALLLPLISMVQHPTTNISAGNLRSGARVALVGMGANVVLATAKILAGALGNSYVLIADGIESALDIAGSAIIWGGLKFAARPADETHPYGHGKAEPVAAIIVSLGVLAAALVIAVRSVHEIFQPHHAPAPFTLAVLIVVVAVKELLFRIVDRLGRNAESTAIQTDAWHHRTDAMTSVAAFIGISIALIGGPRWQSADAWAALFACVLIAANGWRLFYPALHEVLDTAPRGEIIERVRAAAEAVPGVLEIDKCFVRKMGLEYYVDLHVGVDERISVRAGHELAHEVKDAIKQTNPRIADVLVHVEPAAPADEV
ncbi:MAG TPA: cation diffusion facilitator family transporter [Chthoniobacterales bacterium]|nr:cation diffusion facilitator family transporter [Chthoniobacterales bacterium]